MNSHRRLLVVAVWACICTAAAPVFAQVDRANIEGTVTDSTGALIAGAKITITYPQTGFTRTAVSSDAGAYALPAVPIGDCTLSATAPGFSPTTVENLRLTVGESRTINLKLGLTANDTVTVSGAEAPIDKDSATTGGLIGSEQVQNLPINGRNWAGLMMLIPGAINTGSGNQTSIRFAGHGLDDNKILFDGVDATGILRQSQKSDLRIQISSDSIAEFRVNSAMYSAEFGGSSGGQGDVVSRSGSNQFHASVYEFLRNDVLNARALFSTSQLPFRLNQYGASLGGPIWKNRTFFFLNYEALRQKISQPLVGFVPSASFITQLQASAPAVIPLLAGYPAGQTHTSNPSIDNWSGSGSNSQNEDFGLVRIDHEFTSKTSAFFRFNLDQGRLKSPLGNSSGFLLDRLATVDDPKNAVISLQHSFSATLLNSTKFSVNRTPFTNQQVSQIPFQLAVPGFTTLNNNIFQLQNSTAYSGDDTVNWSFGKHSIKAGAGFRRVQINLGNTVATQLTYTSLANFAANKMDSASVQSAVATEGARKTEYDGFAEDLYKLRSNITVSFGLRYDYFSVFHEVHGRAKPFDPVTCGGFCPLGSEWYFPDRIDLGPRLAVTWSPSFLHDSTVLRGGYGLYFGEGQLGDLTGPLNNLTSSLAITSAQIPGLSYPIDPFLPLGATIAVAPRGLARNRVNQQVNQWGLSVGQKLPGQVLLNIGYVGSHGAHLNSRTYLNVLDPVTKTRPLPNFGQVDYKKMGNNANFHGLLTTLNRSFSSGLLFTTTYLWSHSTNDGSTGGGEQAYPQNIACRVCERASSDQDVTSYFTASSVYELPIGRGKAYFNHGVLGRILTGTQLSGLALARTGLPLNVTLSRSASTIPDGNSSSPQRPNLVPGVSLIPLQGRSPQHWINPAAFTTPASGTFGNAPRNLLRGPGTWQMDMSLQKELLGFDRFRMDFRGEAFNVFNHSQYGLPATNYSSGNFGQITTQLNTGATGTGTQRVFQVSLRFTY